MGTAKAIEKIPEHLMPHVAIQSAAQYTAIDHAAWRYILRVSRKFFAENAHPTYLAGLEETGISSDRIPLISEMDQKLRQFGWRAIPVSGFIPPAVFMEFQSLGILPIAAEMRTLEHLAYTPAPDIVHEAAGHAPIIADPAYAAYLRAYGEVARKAIFSHEDQALYEAIRALSDVKENPSSSPEQIKQAETNLDVAQKALTYTSEANLLARMYWWTVEYGLIGDLSAPKIYGAGLLSSMSESFHCLGESVKRLPFSNQCVKTEYDITKPQPQLFVTESFEKLTEELHRFAETMAFKRGGVFGLERAKEAKAVATLELDTGIQISGKLTRFDLHQNSPSFIKFEGPVQIAYQDQELPGHSGHTHAHGFSSPLGPIAKGSLENWEEGQARQLTFESGAVLHGKLISKTERGGQTVVARFDDCTIMQRNEKWYDPEWGTFDLVCGQKVVSVFGGAADRAAYLSVVPEPEPVRIPVKPPTGEMLRRAGYYQKVRDLREYPERGGLEALVSEIRSQLPEEWLIRIELLEFALDAPTAQSLRSDLDHLSQKSLRDGTSTHELITRGLSV